MPKVFIANFNRSLDYPRDGVCVTCAQGIRGYSLEDKAGVECNFLIPKWPVQNYNVELKRFVEKGIYQWLHGIFRFS
jgi:hypothetical protein